ncbi:shikimate dehydrogenase [Xinfangfangia sp. CPCC 101601]|uniref:Shikimate dehydrogenase n=1 Tax=Pseudogemmobacter lacusdianii TaxID=3069608 RepID=A0ABU0VTI1_9RHOB|nr:shikimate dehydrogenase [Xinfangfangia sp. CPCC 101601]MDQ2064843.1 shikimate dehydrogenase [Xinfangfangia sp. CPCC 101601]
MADPNAALLSVTGETRLYVVIGDPIRQVRSTQLYNRLSAERGHDVVFVPLQFSEADFETSIKGLRSFKNLAGIIATIPHKPKLMPVIDLVLPRATVVGAANSIRIEADGSWTGDIFDGVGYVNGLRSEGIDPAGKSVLLIGAGGAGAACAVELAQAGVAKLRIVELDRKKLEWLLSSLQAAYPGLDVAPGEAAPEGFDIVANATPVGMREEDPFVVDPARLSPNQIISEMIMKPNVTRFLEAAAARGCRTHIGYHALMGQANATMSFFGLE